MGVALEHARKYHYIDSNPARDTITRFGNQGRIPDPYTVEQMRILLANAAGTQWEIIVVLSCLYGLRLGEILGLRWRNVDLLRAQQKSRKWPLLSPANAHCPLQRLRNPVLSRH